MVLCCHGLYFSPPDASTLDQVEEFVAESAIMLDFDHPNVIKLLAVCFNTQDNLPLIVLPYMANGDLKSFLQHKRHHCAKGALPEVGLRRVVRFGSQESLCDGLPKPVLKVGACFMCPWFMRA